MSAPRRFAGRTVIVTGGGTGIGRATAIRFATEGAALLLVGRRQPVLDSVAASIPTAGGNARVHVADIVASGGCLVRRGDSPQRVAAHRRARE